jgi:hypothetical protein
MDTPEYVQATLQTGMWTTSIDLKDAYFHVPIHTSYQKFLRFQVLGKVYHYIDDWFNRANSRKEAIKNTQSLLHLVGELGWIVNPLKLDLIPSQEFEFLSYRYNLVSGKVFPTEKRFQDIVQKITKLLENPLTTLRSLMSVIGLLESTVRLVPLG